MATIVSYRYDKHASDKFDMLLEQDLHAKETEDVATKLLMNEDIKVKCSLPSKLKLIEGTKVTKELFRTTASLGHKRVLEQLAGFSQIESAPEKWLTIARLYNAADRGNNDRAKALLANGLEPNVADPYGETPLVKAVLREFEVAVQMLLSGGAFPDGGPSCESSSLHKVVLNGHYGVLKILVDAGASIDFGSHRAKTPARPAEKYGEILSSSLWSNASYYKDKWDQRPQSHNETMLR